MEIGLSRDDALCRSKWSVGVNQIACWGYYQILNIGVSAITTLLQYHLCS